MIFQIDVTNVYEEVEEQGTDSSVQNSTLESTPRGTENEEEESKSKLIAHYSKLLPWIYYVLKC